MRFIESVHISLLHRAPDLALLLTEGAVDVARGEKRARHTGRRVDDAHVVVQRAISLEKPDLGTGKECQTGEPAGSLWCFV